MSELKEAEVKHIFLLTRDLSKQEKNELKKWFKVYEYSSETVNNRTMTELLNEYDVILINIFESDDRQFYSENLKLLENNKNVIRLFIGKLKEESKEEKEDIIATWNIDFFTKKIPTACESKEQLLHKLLCVLLPKPKKSGWGKWAWQGLLYALSYLLPKCSSN